MVSVLTGSTAHIVESSISRSSLYTCKSPHVPLKMRSSCLEGPLARGDGCPDVYNAFKTSDEPIVPQLSHLLPDGSIRDPIRLPEYENITLQMINFRNKYTEYWASTSSATKTGKSTNSS